MCSMILAADVGGSKTLVGLFEPGGPRPRLVEVQVVRTLAFDGLPHCSTPASRATAASPSIG